MKRFSMLWALGPTAFVAAVLVTACGGGGGGATPPLGPANGAAAGAAAPAPGTTSITYASSTLDGATYLGPAHFGTLGLDIVPTVSNGPGLRAYAAEVSNPSSPAFRQFLTPQEIGDRFGAPAGDYQAQAAYFARHGLSVDGWPQRLLMHVGGTQAQLESALGAKFAVYQKNGQQFIALSGAPQLPAALHVAAVWHASGAEIQPQVPSVFQPLLGPTVGFSPQQLARAFDYDTAWAAGYDGTGITIGIIGTDPISSQDVPFYSTVFNNVRVATVTQINAQNSVVFPSAAPTNCASPYQYFVCNYSQGLASPPPVTAPCKGSLPACNPEGDGEAQLDTETVAALAPGSSVDFYLAYNPTECFAQGNYSAPGATCPPTSPTATPVTPAPEIGISLDDDEIQQAIADNRADVISMSIGGCEPYDIGSYFDASGNGYGPNEFAALVAEGIAVFVSSGDTGVTGCAGFGGSAKKTKAVQYPGSDPSVVGVGGVFAPLDQTGTLVGQIAGWAFQNTDGATCDNCSGSTGGVSQVFTPPPSQFGPGLTGTMRNVPDISNDAAVNSPILIVQNVGVGGPSYTFGGGTSQAAPMSAAMWALVLQACSKTPSCATAGGAHPYRLGDPKPYLYAIYNNQTVGSFAPQLPYASTFYDVLYGTNTTDFSPPVYGYNAGPGYDNVTGIGVPYAREMIKAIVGI